MTEISYFHNGAFTGNAAIAPYNDVEFHKATDVIYNNEYSNAIWTYSGAADVAVKVFFSAGQTVHATCTGALIKGVYIECDNDVVLENNDTVYPRLDTIVFRINWNSRTVDLLAVRGAPSAQPVAATLQQSFGDIWEHPLAYCYINPSFTGFDSSYVYNVGNRFSYYYNYYFPTAPNEIFGFWYPNNKNIIHNGEFLSGPATAGDGIAPAMWKTTGTPIITNTETYAYINSRNTTPLKITLTSTDTFYTEKYLGDNRYKPITTVCLLQVISGELKISHNGGVSTSRRVGPTAEPLEVILQTAFSGGTDVVAPHFSTDDETVFYLWEVCVGEPWVRTSLTPTHEHVLYGFPKELFFSNVESTLHSFDADAGSANLLVENFASAISAAGEAYAYVQPPASTLEALRTEIGFLPNGISRENQGWISTVPYITDTLKARHSQTLSEHTINCVGILT